jgi:hypothetical protein
LFPLFPFSNLFFIFFILSNAKVGRNKYALEKEKRKWWIWGLEKIQMQMVDEEWKKMGKLPVYLPTRASHL